MKLFLFAFLFAFALPCLCLASRPDTSENNKVGIIWGVGMSFMSHPTSTFKSVANYSLGVSKNFYRPKYEINISAVLSKRGISTPTAYTKLSLISIEIPLCFKFPILQNQKQFSPTIDLGVVSLVSVYAHGKGSFKNLKIGDDLALFRHGLKTGFTISTKRKISTSLHLTKELSKSIRGIENNSVGSFRNFLFFKPLFIDLSFTRYF